MKTSNELDFWQMDKSKSHSTCPTLESCRLYLKKKIQVPEDIADIYIFEEGELNELHVIDGCIHVIVQSKVINGKSKVEGKVSTPCIHFITIDWTRVLIFYFSSNS